MTSISTVVANLPPASLAETDLARFCALALGRRGRAELPGLAALFGEESLRGYAPSLGRILQAFVETVIHHHLDPNGLDARTADGLLGSSGFLARLEQKVSVNRQRLRPGTMISATLRQTLGMRLLVLPGVGKELVLVAPVDLAQVPDAQFAVPLGVVLARNATIDEAETLRTTWAVIEERFGLAGPEAAEWTARFLAFSRRENHDARAAAAGLQALDYEQRMVLWETLVAHLRDGELPEQHRSGRRGLERRLGELGLMTDAHSQAANAAVPDWVEATLSLIESVYRAAGLDPEVMAGRCPVPAEDVERWAGWVDVAATAREHVRKLSTDAIAAALVRLAEEEAGRTERDAAAMPESLARGLASLRDGCLRPRWQRSRWALTGIDPLVLARARIASGDDTSAIREALEALAQEAARSERPRPQVSEAAGRLSASSALALGKSASTPAGAPPEEQPLAPALNPLGAEPDAPTDASDELGDPRGLRPSRFHLPPMPSVPPPRPAPRVRPRTDFPPMPVVPPRPMTKPLTQPQTLVRAERPRSELRSEPASPEIRADVPRSEAPRAEAPRPEARAEPRSEPRSEPAAQSPPARVATQRSPTARVMPQRPTTASSPPLAITRDAPRIARPRTGATAPHLVTPTQGNEFYDASFRELELIERDLVQRGPYPGAAERVQAIAAEAAELYAALGPSARSGDREFQAAQRRIEKVQAYLERVQALLSSAPRSSESRAASKPSILGRWFGKK